MYSEFSIFSFLFSCFRFPQLSFDYSDPCPGFDRGKVKGPVARLVHLKCSAPTALEVVAGGKVRDNPHVLCVHMCRYVCTWVLLRFLKQCLIFKSQRIYVRTYVCT